MKNHGLVGQAARSRYAFFAIAFVVLSCGSAAAAEWSQFQGNARHTGYVATTGLPAQATPMWTVETIAFLDSTPATQFTPGVVSDGTNVFLSWIGSPGTINGVSAIDIHTGAEAWEWLFQGKDAETISAPAYENGRVYVHRWGHSSSHDNPRLLGIDATNGQQLFDQTHSGQWSSGGRPTVVGGQVYVAGGYYGGLDNYDGVTGQIEWFESMPQTYGWIPAADARYVYTSFGGNLQMTSIATGDHVANLLAPHGGDSGSSTPIVVGDHEAYATRGRLITQFDPTNRYAVWDYESSSGSANQGMAVGDEALYINFGTSVTALRRQDGQLLWSWAAPSTLSSNLVLTDTHLFVGDATSTYAFSLATHIVDWSAPYSGDLAAVDGVLFVSNSEALHAFSLVPEPSSILLLAVGALFVLGARTRVRRK